MAGKKRKDTKLKVFSGRAGRANAAIFDILLKESPQKIKRILKLITNYDGLEETYYASLTKRLHALQQEEYAKEVKESPKTQASYELRIKAYLSMVLRENNMQDIIDKATDTQRAFILLALLNVILSEKDSGSQPSGKGDVES